MKRPLFLWFFAVAITIAAEPLVAAEHSVTNGAALAESSTHNQAATKLQAFDRGELSLEAITEDPTSAELLLNYYAAGTNRLTTKQKLPVSRVLAMTENFQEASRLAEEYVEVYSNDWRGWRIIGGANVSLGKYEKALGAEALASAKGDTNNLSFLVALAIKLDRMDMAKAAIRPLLLYRDSMPKGSKDYDQAVLALVMYARQASNEKVFSRAVEGVPIANIVSREDLKQMIEGGCKQFDNEKNRQLLSKMAEFKEPKQNLAK